MAKSKATTGSDLFIVDNSDCGWTMPMQKRIRREISQNTEIKNQGIK